jgi:hypothetical protein
VDALLDVFTGLVAHLLDLFLGLRALFFLGIRELSDCFYVTRAAQINKLATSLHVQHQLTMFEEVRSEGVLENEKFLIEEILSLGSVLLLDLLFPHAHELPLFELLEKAEFFDVVVGVSFNQPLAQ